MWKVNNEYRDYFLEIKKLSTAQKILLLEQAWDDVSQFVDEISADTQNILL